MSRPRPPHRAAAAATASDSQCPNTMVRPPNLAAGQPARPPSPRQQQQPPPPETETDEAYRNRVYARLIAEMKLQKAQQDSAARAGQQRIGGQTASAQPACSHDEGGNRHVGAEAMVPPTQFPAPHGGYPYSSSSNLAQRPQGQQSSSATTAAVETPAVPPGASANEGSGKEDAATIADNIILQILSAEDWSL